MSQLAEVAASLSEYYVAAQGWALLILAPTLLLFLVGTLLYWLWERYK